MKPLNANERAVLVAMADYGVGYFMNFHYFADKTKLDRKAVRRACRSLSRKGLSAFRIGLWSEDGEPAGAGYGITEQGSLALASLEVAQ